MHRDEKTKVSKDERAVVLPYVITGFYTPNYSSIAANLVRSLDAHAVCHRIYAVEPIGATWQGETLRKPQIVLRAMADHPDTVVVFMDVDCTVNGPLDPLVSNADIGLHFFQKGRRRVITSSRVVAFRPTPCARRVVELWQKKCLAAISSLQSRRVRSRDRMSHKHTETDEGLLMEAVLSVPNVTIRQFPREFIGLTDGLFDHVPLIEHDSAREKFAAKQNLKRFPFITRLFSTRHNNVYL